VAPEELEAEEATPSKKRSRGDSEDAEDAAATAAEALAQQTDRENATAQNKCARTAMPERTEPQPQQQPQQQPSEPKTKKRKKKHLSRDARARDKRRRAH
jgi:hypothetical protein